METPERERERERDTNAQNGCRCGSDFNLRPWVGRIQVFARRPKIKLTAQTGTMVVGGGLIDRKTYLSVMAVNCGDRATTIDQDP